MALLLRNFRPVGFKEKATLTEIAVDDEGRIADRAIDNAEIIDCRGAWLSPGWADLHVHVWHGGTDISIRADEAGLKRGVTAMADAGSAGEATFHGLREYVIERQRETIKAFVNIGSIGLFLRTGILDAPPGTYTLMVEGAPAASATAPATWRARKAGSSPSD